VSEFFAAYGLFLAQLATFILVLVVGAVIVVSSRRRGHAEGLVVEHLNRRFEDSADELKLAIEGKGRFKKAVKLRRKERKREDKARASSDRTKPRLFVLDFKGDLRASAAASLREEVSAILRVARSGDEVLVRLENSGGTVHEHGFAASQLVRLKQHGLKLLVAVDKVAASGGYLMACVADRLLAAPFAIVGSIGVLAQLPNLHRLLEEKGVDRKIMADLAVKDPAAFTLLAEKAQGALEKVKG
jgi:serine protease SohB